jgi:23S rRNA-/tRNA-specific pseudouridylate synthase
MRELKINSKDEGQRLDKFLLKYLNASQKSFIYKMLRKKNIKLNGKKSGRKRNHYRRRYDKPFSWGRYHQ